MPKPKPPLDAAQERLLAKLRGDIDSVSGTASYALKYARTGINRQEAKKDRTDALGGLILEKLGKHLGATEAEVLEALKKQERKGVIESITDSVIEWTDKDGSAQETEITALKHRISRARKKLQSR
ncbi:MAG TPA: hypothetical protein VE735_07865 [Gammaproteobacteria bacterium]|jgi:hypothetical protein|nr:hypothetical protein [Gammaproteobacteria bacterium]